MTTIAEAPARYVTKTDARALMDEIIDVTESGVSAFEHAMALAKRFEEGAMFKALGYRSMAACWASEMGVTRGRWYQLRDQFAQSAMLSEAAGTTVVVSQHQAERLKRHPEVHSALYTSIEAGEPPADAIRREAPVTRAHFDDGYGSGGSDFDSGAAVYECRHCGRKGAISELTKCLTVLRDEQQEWGS